MGRIPKAIPPGGKRPAGEEYSGNQLPAAGGKGELAQMIRAAVIGAGGFVRATHLPNMRANPRYQVRAIADINEQVAAQVAAEYEAAYHSTDYRDVLADPEVDLAVITTPHHQHAPISVAAAKAGKHILVEKPMAMTAAEVREVLEAVRAAGTVFTVGFNRRYAPLAVRAKRLADSRQCPMMIMYRMVDQIWQHSWALAPGIGGGRIISEACHIFDFIAWLVGSPPVRVHAEGGLLSHPDDGRVVQDNAVMTVKFADGSLAAVCHGDLGHSAYPKEHVAMFLGEKTVVIDNFQGLEVYGFPAEEGERLPGVDKGLVAEVEELGKAIMGEPCTLLREDEAALAMLATIKALASVQQGRTMDISKEEFPWL